MALTPKTTKYVITAIVVITLLIVGYAMYQNGYAEGATAAAGAATAAGAAAYATGRERQRVDDVVDDAREFVADSSQPVVSPEPVKSVDNVADKANELSS
jgi:uncharacterized membrane protein